MCNRENLLEKMNHNTQRKLCMTPFLPVGKKNLKKNKIKSIPFNPNDSENYYAHAKSTQTDTLDLCKSNLNKN